MDTTFNLSRLEQEESDQHVALSLLNDDELLEVAAVHGLSVDRSTPRPELVRMVKRALGSAGSSSSSSSAKATPAAASAPWSEALESLDADDFGSDDLNAVMGRPTGFEALADEHYHTDLYNMQNPMIMGTMMAEAAESPLYRTNPLHTATAAAAAAASRGSIVSLAADGYPSHPPTAHVYPSAATPSEVALHPDGYPVAPSASSAGTTPALLPYHQPTDMPDPQHYTGTVDLQPQPSTLPAPLPHERQPPAPHHHHHHQQQQQPQQPIPPVADYKATDRSAPVAPVANTSRKARVRTLARQLSMWKPPTERATVAFINARHPRQFDAKQLKYRRYPVVSTKTGRHCCRMCVCCDPFGEKQDSEFMRFGSGVSLYFKFVKWLGWTFAMMSLCYVPMIVLNTFGRTSSGATEDIVLSSTTLGNLGDAVNVTSVFIPSTSCGDSRCAISKEKVATLYGWMDLLASIVFFCSYLLLHSHERREAKVVGRRIVTIRDFSVHVKRLPKDTTEAEVSSFFEAVTGCRVAEVSLAKDNTRLVAMCAERGQLIRRLEYLEDRVALLKYKNKPVGPKMMVRKKELRKLVARLERQQRSVGPGPKAVLSAFVTFEHEKGTIRCAEAYPDDYMRRLCMSRDHRFRGIHRIKVIPAPDPSTVLWENLAFGSLQRFARRLMTTVVSVLLIFVSFALLYWASYRQQEAEKTGGDQPCPSTAVTARDAIANPNVLHCYCESISASDVAQDPLCRTWLADKALALTLSLVAAGSVVAINFLLRLFLRRLTVVEKHHSLDSQAKSLARRLFIAQFINTAIVTLVANAHLSGDLFVQAAGYRDFEAQWYTTVGAGIIVTMILNSVSPHVAPLGHACATRLRRRWAQPVSQHQVNALFLGPPWRLSVRYAQLLNLTFVTLMYGAGLPLLLPIAVGSVFISFWVDKTLFLRLYQTPPLYNHSLGKSMSGMLPYALLLHLGFSVWMLSNVGIFSTHKASAFKGASDASSAASTVIDDDSAGDRVSQAHVFPLFFLFVVMLVSLVAFRLFRGLKTCAGKLLSLVLCGLYEPDDQFDTRFRKSKPLPSFTECLAQRRLHGLATYNILQTPRFREAFAISSSFSGRHRDVEAVLTSHVPRPRLVSVTRRHKQEAAATAASATAANSTKPVVVVEMGAVH